MSLDLQHPAITQTLKTGYPNLVEQPEHIGVDYFGFEILAGDEVVEYDGEIVLRENLNDFLQELGFEFKTV
jgi:hypothetical protein